MGPYVWAELPDSLDDLREFLVTHQGRDYWRPYSLFSRRVWKALTQETRVPEGRGCYKKLKKNKVRAPVRTPSVDGGRLGRVEGHPQSGGSLCRGKGGGAGRTTHQVDCVCVVYPGVC